MKKFTKTGIIILVLVAVVISIYGFIDGYKDSTDRADLISKVLEENCDCEEVNQIIYAKGIQFGKEGITTEKAEYQLIDCEYESFLDEASRINKLLTKEVKGFEEFDLLTIEMNNETLIIKNGRIQY